MHERMRTVVCAAAVFVLMLVHQGDRVAAAARDAKVTPGALVAVSYRKQGDAQWKEGLPLLRLQGERIYQQGSWDVVSPNMFAGSILDLEPDTAYEARFVLSDPDGVTGQSAKSVTKTVTVRTRPEPKPYVGGRVY